MADDAVAEGITSLLPITWGPNALDQLEREAIRRALTATNGNQTHAAKLLGIQRLALMRAMARHGLAPTTQRGPHRHLTLARRGASQQHVATLQQAMSSSSETAASRV